MEKVAWLRWPLLSAREYALLGRVRQHAGQWRPARDAFERALWLLSADDPIRPDVENDLAVVCLAERDPRALAALDEALARRPCFPRHSSIARALRLSAARPRARPSLDRLSADPALPPSLRAGWKRTARPLTPRGTRAARPRFDPARGNGPILNDGSVHGAQEERRQAAADPASGGQGVRPQGLPRRARVEIARRADVADGTIYLYFRNKEDILVSLFDEVMIEHLRQGREELSALSGAPEKLHAIARRHLGLLGGNRDLAWSFQVELRQSTKFMERFTASWLHDYFALLADIIEEGQAEGGLRADVPLKLVSSPSSAPRRDGDVLDLSRRDYDLPSWRRRWWTSSSTAPPPPRRARAPSPAVSRAAR
jgi:AcrR family transcriptional regulator